MGIDSGIRFGHSLRTYRRFILQFLRLLEGRNSRFVKVIQVTVQQQDNECDCGVHLIDNAERFLVDPKELQEGVDPFPNQDVGGKREQVLEALAQLITVGQEKTEEEVGDQEEHEDAVEEEMGEQEEHEGDEVGEEEEGDEEVERLLQRLDANEEEEDDEEVDRSKQRYDDTRDRCHAVKDAAGLG
jgi:hypothetical protein